MTISHRLPFASLAAAAWLIAAGAAAQADTWAIDVRPSRGSVTAEAARPVIEAARAPIAACADGPGPHRFEFAVDLRPNGQVREATPDRRSTTDPRAARCIRHALLELRFPASSAAASFALTLSAGAFEPSPPSTAPSGPTPDAPPGPTPGPIVIPVPTPMPAPGPTDATAGPVDVTVGAVPGSADRTAAQLLSVITPQRSALLGCYTTARSADAALAGDAMLHLTLSPDGHVTNAMFQGPEALASALATCVGRVARTWTFGATTAEARISVPLTFGAARPVRH